MKIVKRIALMALDLANELPDASVSIELKDRDGDNDKDLAVVIHGAPWGPITIGIPFGFAQLRKIIESI